MTLDDELERLADCARVAGEIGLTAEASRAERLLEDARERSGFRGDVYVLALAGGTGVGKSSLLNALAGHTVSAVRAVRPTTDEPIAWVADERREELAPLLAWLEVRHVATHADEDLSGVAILDLPDVDSVRTEHRATVDALLPRIDAVAWVLDPEKYDDARLHHYLRGMTPHADRLRFVLNKADRLTEPQREDLIADLRKRLSASGIATTRIDVVSAMTGEGIDALRAGMAREADAKALVTAKLTTDAVEARDRLARAVGLDPRAAYRPLVDDRRSSAATQAAVDGALALVDLPGVARQVRLAVLGRARRSGGSLLGRAVALLGWLTGQTRRTADPAAYVQDWRRRGSLGRAVNPVHAVLVEATAAVPPGSRPALLRALRADTLESELALALDDAARDAAVDLRVPGSILWSLVGAVQLAIGAVFIFAVAWYVTLFVSQGVIPVATIEAPWVGPLPLPLVLLAGSIVASAALGFLVSLHAGWIGRRAGARVAERTRGAITASVTEAGFSGLSRVEQARGVIGGSGAR
ncbi:MAG: GTPase [Candidatus Limnocylindria bacterium]